MPLGTFRTRFSIIVAVAAMAAVSAGCGGGAATGDVDKITVVQSQFDVAITNTSGRALFDVKTEIEPAGPASHFSTIIARMENGERRVLAHNLFSDRDSVPFSARNVKAKGIIVTAKDIDGKALKLEVPWKR
jgi:ABC-type glycerol-3-phosphate transport system substrate-binding protein